MGLLGERWTLLIIRELIIGSTRFSEFQRGLAHIPRTLLTRRLASLEQEGLIVKRRILGQRGYECYTTDACQALQPVLEELRRRVCAWPGMQ